MDGDDLDLETLPLLAAPADKDVDPLIIKALIGLAQTALEAGEKLKAAHYLSLAIKALRS